MFDIVYMSAATQITIYSAYPAHLRYNLLATEFSSPSVWHTLNSVCILSKLHNYPEADCIRLVNNNLNTYVPSALYETFTPAESQRILNKLKLR